MAPKAKAEPLKTEPALRMGPWTPEEVAYTQRLSSDFQLGLLEDVRQGMSLRQWLSQMLHCSPMRISKKFEVEPSLRARCNYLVNWQRIKSLTPHEVYARKKELETLERNFKKSTESQDYVRLMQSMRTCYEKYRKGPKAAKAAGARASKRLRKEASTPPTRKKHPRRAAAAEPDYEEPPSSVASPAASPVTSSTLSPPQLPSPVATLPMTPAHAFPPSKQPPARRTLADRAEVSAVFQEYLHLMHLLHTSGMDVKESLVQLQLRTERLSMEQGMTPLTVGVLNAIRAGICIAEAMAPLPLASEESLNDSSAIETLLCLSRAFPS
ncbi:hypothetical protein ACHHYP_04426 [Achlya hypogyna]|uniref:Uncharacterized protein n=1 Tax=Achlya hypogyna TaxID=1202772 RepID=A0A1V9ZP64_ACHHY|nr:hypothetical protein ACHHYP_04426 [Achlya hypogyna]